MKKDLVSNRRLKNRGKVYACTQPGETKDFSATHQYLEGNPTNTLSDDYTITVAVHDDDTGVGTDDATITVKNVYPELDLPPEN